MLSKGLNFFYKFMDIPCRMILPFHDAVYIKMGNK